MLNKLVFYTQSSEITVRCIIKVLENKKSIVMIKVSNISFTKQDMYIIYILHYLLLFTPAISTFWTHEVYFALTQIDIIILIMENYGNQRLSNIVISIYLLKE